VLYRHALECIFSFLPFHELRRVVWVSRLWRDGVASMAPVEGGGLLRPVVRDDDAFVSVLSIVAASVLGRHVCTLWSDGSGNGSGGPLSLTATRWQQIARGLPSLMSLRGSIAVVEVSALAALPASSLPAHLCEVSLDLAQQPAPTTPAQLCGVLAFLSRLPSLATLQLLLGGLADVDFSPLADAPSLRSLDVRSPVSLTSAHVPQLRLLRQLTSLTAPLSSEDLVELLAPPCSLHLEQLNPRCLFTEECCAALAHLPSLTAFRESFFSCRTADFLLRLPRLRIVSLGFPPKGLFMPVALSSDEHAQILAAVQRCSGLTELTLNAFTNASFQPSPATLTSLLSSLPLLESFTLLLKRPLDSLCFLAAGALPHRCRSLHLRAVGVRAQALAESEQLLQLRALTKLTLRSTEFQPDAGVTAQLQELFGQPSARLPLLTDFQ
jgi:hypothetical protein